MRTVKTLATLALLSIFSIGCSNRTLYDTEGGSTSSTTPVAHTVTTISTLEPAKTDTNTTPKPDADKPAVADSEDETPKTTPTSTKTKTGADRLHGKWSGVTTISQYGVTLKLTVTFDFKPDGRVFWKEKIEVVTQIPGGNEAEAFSIQDSSEGSGTYKITRIEGDRFTLKLTNDLDPDRTFGWVVVFKGQDQITVTGFEDVPVTVQRKK